MNLLANPAQSGPYTSVDVHKQRGKRESGHFLATEFTG